MTLNEMYERSKSDLEGLTDENVCEYYARYSNFLGKVKGIKSVKATPEKDNKTWKL